VLLYSPLFVVPRYLTLKALRHRSHSFICNYTNACLYRIKCSPDGDSPDWGCGHLVAAYYSFIYPKRMKEWVSCRSSAGKGKFAGQKPTLYHYTTVRRNS